MLTYQGKQIFGIHKRLINLLPDVLTSVINDQKITVYTGNQNYSHRIGFGFPFLLYKSVTTAI